MPDYTVALVSFGAKSTERLRYILGRLNVTCRVLFPDETPSFHYTHIILSGGPKHVYEADTYTMPEWVLQSTAPVLGVCYGMQLIAHTFGGRVTKMSHVEKGPVEVTEMIKGEQLTSLRWMNRLDQVVSIPDAFTITGVTSSNHIASFTDHHRWWAVQYHPEASKHGDASVLRRFLRLVRTDTVS